MFFNWLKSVKKQPEEIVSDRVCDAVAPQEVRLKNGAFLALDGMLFTAEKFVTLDWERVDAWVEHEVAVEDQREALQLVQQVWLLHLRDGLKGGYYLFEDDENYILSSLEPHLAKAALVFMNRAKKRVLNLLQDMAGVHNVEKDVLIICHDDHDYYAYISNFYADDDLEIARSGGVFLNYGSKHFVTIKGDLSFMEPVIVHELTHQYLSHLPLPLWLNEGIAMSVERRLAGYVHSEWMPQEMFDRHRAHWDEQTIQEFWSGQSFQQQETMNLSYDLAERMVSIFAQDWQNFSLFVQNAAFADAANEAANQYFGVSLGGVVSGMLGKAQDQGWEP
ncbi:MAG: hypothetical protein ACRCWR_05360 [Saezia sp.]